VRILDEELERLNRAIERLLPAAAPASDRRGRFDLAPVARDVEALLSPGARQQRVALKVAVPDEPVFLDGSRDQVRQVLLAIALNGLEAMPDGGTLAIAVSSEDGRAVVSVTDTGLGLPGELGDRAFDIYSSTKAGHRGLGLFVARAMVESASGTLSHSPARGRGCRFDLTLPLAAKTTQEH
jgi:two-component system, sporulation sensor kinase D